MVLEGYHAKMFHNKEGYQLECDKLLHKGEGGGVKTTIFHYLLFEWSNEENCLIIKS